MQLLVRANYAFIDAQNLNFGLNKLGWKIDWKKFRTYLTEERNVEVAYVFIGFMLGNQDLYLVLQKAGFVVVFKEVFTNQAGDVKGNIDAELILQAMIDYDRYDKALIVSWDGDFTCLLRYLEQNNKFEWVIAPYEKSLSSLIERAAEGKIEHLRSLRRKLEYKYGPGWVKKSGPKPERIRFEPEVKEKTQTRSVPPISRRSDEPVRHPTPPPPSETQKPLRNTPPSIQQRPTLERPSKASTSPWSLNTRKISQGTTVSSPTTQKSVSMPKRESSKKTEESHGDERYDGFWEM